MSTRGQGQRQVDLTTWPIIACHWFGVKPLHPIGEVVVGVVADLERQWQFGRAA